MFANTIYISLTIVSCYFYITSSNAQQPFLEACNYLGCSIQVCDITAGNISCDASKCASRSSYNCDPKLGGPLVGCEYLRCSVAFCERVQISCDLTNCGNNTYDCNPPLSAKCQDVTTFLKGVPVIRSV